MALRGRCSARGLADTIACEFLRRRLGQRYRQGIELKDVTMLHAGYGEIPAFEQRSIRPPMSVFTLGTAPH